MNRHMFKYHFFYYKIKTDTRSSMREREDTYKSSESLPPLAVDCHAPRRTVGGSPRALHSLHLGPGGQHLEVNPSYYRLHRQRGVCVV